MDATREPLLSLPARPAAPSSQDIELHSVGPLGSIARAADGTCITLVSERWRDPVLGTALAAAILLSAVAVASGVVDVVFVDPHQRSWLLLGFAYYIFTMWRSAWDWLMWVLARNLYVRVVVRRMEASLLYESINTQLEEAAEVSPHEFSSRDCEAFTDYEKEKGTRTVKFSFWGVHGRSLKLNIYSKPEHAKLQKRMKRQLAKLQEHYEDDSDISEKPDSWKAEMRK